MGAACSTFDCWRRLVARITAVVATACFGAAASGQTTWFVSNDPGENPDFPGLWEALESPLIVDGDTVEVSEGLGFYSPPTYEYFSFNGKAITVRAEANERPVLVGDWPGVPVTGLTFLFAGEGPDSVLDGFEIIPGGQDAIVVQSGTPTIRNCLFSGSGRNATAEIRGGHPRFESCVFSGCGGQFNEYILVYASATFTDCVFENAVNPFGGIRNSGTLNLIGCDFVANSAGLNGDVFSTGTLHIESCRFMDTCKPNPNFAKFRSVVDARGRTTIVNTLFDNCCSPTVPLLTLVSGPGVEQSITNCTISRNPVRSIVSAGGSQPVVVTNTVVWGNAIGMPLFDGMVGVQYSNIQGGWPGTGNISQDPLFRDPFGDDFRLRAGSPCIDAGDNTAVPSNLTLDIYGEPRFRDDDATPDTGNGVAPIVDMGLAEYFLCRADILPNGVVNNDDFFYFLALFLGGSPAADLTTFAVPGTQGYGVPDGAVTNDDFFYYLTIFAEGCDD